MKQIALITTFILSAMILSAESTRTWFLKNDQILSAKLISYHNSRVQLQIMNGGSPRLIEKRLGDFSLKDQVYINKFIRKNNINVAEQPEVNFPDHSNTPSILDDFAETDTDTIQAPDNNSAQSASNPSAELFQIAEDMEKMHEEEIQPVDDMEMLASIFTGEDAEFNFSFLLGFIAIAIALNFVSGSIANYFVAKMLGHGATYYDSIQVCVSQIIRIFLALLPISFIGMTFFKLIGLWAYFIAIPVAVGIMLYTCLKPIKEYYGIDTGKAFAHMVLAVLLTGGINIAKEFLF